MSDPHAREVASGERFAFGANWRLFLAEVDRGRIDQAKATLADMLETKDLAGKRFLDIGCGSGVMSLAASELGADVVSFDFDPDSVACAVEIKNRYRPDATTWRIERGSALDGDYLKGLGTFDVVYSWGVLHHTGAMHAALENAAGAVAPGGRLFIAIYNDQGWISRYWAAIKGLYNRHPWSRPILILLHWPYLVGLRLVYRALTGRGGLER
ncbi:MAG: methyltransferase domain-containing protein, partial [Alphaproteobacteria bacterium]|nr:methyltransferase domain-containing protein [Alphaproteobacteria bacterium]